MVSKQSDLSLDVVTKVFDVDEQQLKAKDGAYNFILFAVAGV